MAGVLTVFIIMIACTFPVHFLTALGTLTFIILVSGGITLKVLEIAAFIGCCVLTAILCIIPIFYMVTGLIWVIKEIIGVLK